MNHGQQSVIGPKKDRACLRLLMGTRAWGKRKTGQSTICHLSEKDLGYPHHESFALAPGGFLSGRRIFVELRIPLAATAGLATTGRSFGHPAFTHTLNLYQKETLTINHK
jgi:hypothetical protein